MEIPGPIGLGKRELYLYNKTENTFVTHDFK